MWLCFVVPELVEAKTSAGQPTTLSVNIACPNEADITWQKEGLPIKHLVLPDGSLYIANTDLSDQGVYTMTATDTNSVDSIRIHLNVINPKMPIG